MDFTEEILEKAKNSNSCPFCNGVVQIDEEIDDAHTKVYCVVCSRSWIEVYDDEGELIDMEPNE